MRVFNIIALTIRKAKQQKHERKEQLQREWAELQKRAAIEVASGGNLQKK